MLKTTYYRSYRSWMLVNPVVVEQAGKCFKYFIFNICNFVADLV